MRHNNQSDLQVALEDNDYFLSEIASMTQTGGYGCNLQSGDVFMDATAMQLLGIPHDFKITYHNLSRFFVNIRSASTLFKRAMLGDSQIRDIQMMRFDGSVFWARLNCKPFVKDQKVVGLRGVFTSVDRYVQSALKAKEDAQVIQAQNERLVHFAHIVSHNLRSHASNLQLTLDTFEDVSEGEEVNVFQSYLKEISSSLNQTLKHLNEVVTINTEQQIIVNIDIEACFNNILKEFKPQLDLINATVVYDFAELLSIEYVPSFLESIFRNLISNAIKYRSPERSLRVSIKTKSRNKRKLLVIKDNGIGIDLERNGNKLFHMYRTFHTNDDARGVGLFLVKSKVEALGGDITVKSKLGKGSSFSVRFN